MPSVDEIKRQFAVFESHVKRYDAEFRKKNTLPKNHDWRPYRWCSRDIVFALLAVRHERSRNCLEVDVCLMANPPQYPENSGPRVAMNFLLSEAFKCGTSMEIVFTGNVEGREENGRRKGRVPAYIYDLACELGIKLKHVWDGHITPFEARQFYMALAGFSQKAQEKIMQLSVKGILSPERACFLVMGGVWTLPEAESIILGSKNPESILLSTLYPERRLLYLFDLIVCRNVVLGGSLDRKMLQKEVVVDGQVMESEDVEAEVDISFDGESFSKIYIVREESIVAPWLGGREEVILHDGDLMVVLVRARSSVEIEMMLVADLNCLKEILKKYPLSEGARIFVLYPRDFDDMPPKTKTKVLALVRDLGARVMVCPESVAILDKQAVERIETGKMVRRE